MLGLRPLFFKWCRELDISDYFATLQAGSKLVRGQLLSLDPWFDEETGLLKVGGRLHFSSYSDEFKHQIILPANHPVVLKLVLHFHVKLSHAGPETTLCTLRQRFWIVQGRRTVSKALRSCLTCRHHRTVPVEQQMAPLPPERVELAPAFTHVGLDFTGPLFIKGEGHVKKVYICIFTCAQSRMVHFEIVQNMETSEFLQAFRRMTNRRGMCRTVISDNQTTFKKAAKMLSEAKSDSCFLDNHVQWKFITEQSPFCGGFYERLNHLLKVPLRKILGKALLTYVELYTIVTDIESSINQRPLTHQSQDPKDPEALTPSHLALGRSLAPFPLLQSSDCSPSVRYRYLERLLSSFWKRWTTEYLPRLQERNKWKRQAPDLQVGDVVLMTEDNIPRRAWPLGLVVELLPGKDGLVRTVKVKTAKGIYSRPVQRLHLYEAASTSSSLNDHAKEVIDRCARGDFDNARNSSSIEADLLRNPGLSQGGEDVVTTTRAGREVKKPQRLQLQ